VSKFGGKDAAKITKDTLVFLPSFTNDGQALKHTMRAPNSDDYPRENGTHRTARGVHKLDKVTLAARGRSTRPLTPDIPPLLPQIEKAPLSPGVQYSVRCIVILWLIFFLNF
jgi:hypothetical protein